MAGSTRSDDDSEYMDAPPPDEPTSYRQPPHNIQAEECVLGVCMHPRFADRGCARLATGILTPEQFFKPAHRKIFAAITDLSNRGETADFVAVAAELERDGNLTVCGGRAELVRLIDAEFTDAHLETHSKIIRDAAIKRNIAKLSAKLTEQCHDGFGDSAEIISLAQTELASVGATINQESIRPIADIASDTLAVFDSYKTGRSGYFIETPFSQLNDMMGGGLREKHYTILAARPGTGKTTFAHNTAAFAAAHDIPVAIFSLEMSAVEIVERMACAMARVDSTLLRSNRLNTDQFDEVTRAVAAIAGLPIHIDDSPTMNDAQLRARIANLASKRGVKMVIVDYLQLLTSAGRSENRQQEVTSISRSCMAASRESSVSLIALSQLSRETEKRSSGRPTLADLRESGSLEQDANNVIFIYNEGQYKAEADARVSELIIGKQRNGPTGSVKVTWFKEETRFTNYAEEGNY